MISASSSKTHTRGEFDRVLLDVFEDVLKRVLGDVAAEKILLYLESNCSLKREETPSNIEAFSSGLTALLGSSAQVLEGLMVRHLCSRLQLQYNSEVELTFPDYVRKLRKRFEELRSGES